MFWLIVVFFVGYLCGMLTMALCEVSSDSEKRAKRLRETGGVLSDAAVKEEEK